MVALDRFDKVATTLRERVANGELWLVEAIESLSLRNQDLAIFYKNEWGMMKAKAEELKAKNITPEDIFACRNEYVVRKLTGSIIAV